MDIGGKTREKRDTISIMSSKSQEGGNGKKKKKKYYAVARGRTVGVYDTWDECNAQVRAYPGASHKVGILDTFSPSFPPLCFGGTNERAFVVSCRECDAANKTLF